MRMGIGLGIGINRSNYAQGIFNAYSARVVVDGGITEGGACVDAVSGLLLSASLLLVPSGYKGGKLYAEIPTNGNGDLTWTRGSDAFRTNASGLIQRVPWNLASQSETFSNASWTKFNSSITADATNAPNGTLTADKLVENTANSTHQILSTSATNVIGTNYVSSIYAKASERNWILVVYFDGSTVKGRYFDLTNGVGGAYWASATIANSITSVGDGWFRITLSYLATSTSNILGVYLANSDNNISYTGNGTSGIFIWGAQLVEGTTAQTYLPTTDRLNFPRLSYMYGSCPSVLLEPQRTNLALYSQEFDDGSWSKGNSSVTVNSTTSPDGNTNADTFIANGSSGVHGISRPVTVAINTVYTISVYAKKNTNDFVQITSSSGFFGASVYANFDLNNGVVGTIGTGTTASIQNLGNGWYRCVMTASTSSSVSSPTFGYYIISSTTSGRAESNSLSTSVFLYGAQLEAGAYPTTYIPTTSATATRVADSFSRNNIYTNGLITSSGGTWFVELRNNTAYTSDTNVGGIFIDDFSAGYNNGLMLRKFTSDRIRILKTTAGSQGVLYLTTTDTTKIAIKWNGTTCDVFANGTKVVSASSFTVTNMQFLGNSTIPLMAFIQQMALYPSPLSDADCTTLTTL